MLVGCGTRSLSFNYHKAVKSFNYHKAVKSFNYHKAVKSSASRHLSIHVIFGVSRVDELTVSHGSYLAQSSGSYLA